LLNAAKLEERNLAEGGIELVDLVGIEPTTSSMPLPLLNVLSITYRTLETAEQRGNTPKTKILQVILQVRNWAGALGRTS
jgi:hypothetical protein